MSYTKHEWVTNETITAAKMNNIEDGIEEAAQSGGGGLDGIITIYHDNNSTHDYVLVIESGTFSALASKLNNDITPAILVKVFDELTGTKGSALAYIYSYDTTGSAPYITLNAYIGTGMDSSKLVVMNYSYIVWDAEDEVTM